MQIFKNCDGLVSKPQSTPSPPKCFSAPYFRLPPMLMFLKMLDDEERSTFSDVATIQILDWISL